MSALPRSVGHLKGVTREAWLDALFMIASIPGHKPDYDWCLRSQKETQYAFIGFGSIPLYKKVWCRYLCPSACFRCICHTL